MLLTYEHMDKKLIQLVWGFLWTSGVLGEVSIWCGIGNVLGLVITDVLLRISVRAFSGIVNDRVNFP